MINILQTDVMKEENENRIITIGNKTDEVYLSTILSKLITYPHVYIKVMNFPDKLAKVNYFYSILVNFGIVRLENPIKMLEPSKRGNGQIEVIIYKWEIIPRIKQWRESLKGNDFLTLGTKI